jgi:uncharacterized protein
MVFTIPAFLCKMENERNWIQATEAMVRSKMEHDATGHDWWHVARVRHMALRLAGEEGADTLIVELAALLHDVWDHKQYEGDDSVAPVEVRKWLESQHVPEQSIVHIVGIIDHISFKGSEVPDEMPTLEGKVVQDADRLDAMGAIGIARTFAYGGSKGRPLFDPDIRPEHHADFEAYKRNSNPTVNHFYEKLLLLKDRMHTTSARRIARARHRYMEAYLDRFFREWNGAD